MILRGIKIDDSTGLSTSSATIQCGVTCHRRKMKPTPPLWSAAGGPIVYVAQIMVTNDPVGAPDQARRVKPGRTAR